MPIPCEIRYDNSNYPQLCRKAVGSCIKRNSLFFTRYVESDRNGRGISPCLTALTPTVGLLHPSQIQQQASRQMVSVRPSIM